MDLSEIGVFIRELGFPCAIALLMFWNNQKMTAMVDEYFKMIFNALHNMEKGDNK